MKNKVWISILWVGLALGGSPLVQAQMERVIDNFKSQPATHAESTDSPIRPRRGTGNPDTEIIGGVRLIEFGAAPNPGGPVRMSLLEIPRDGSLFVESGVNSTVGVTLTYGTDGRGGANPLDFDFQGLGWDRFRIEFLACDLQLNYLVQVFDGNGNNSLLSGTTSTVNRNLPFNADFRKADFPPGAPNPVNWHDIDVISIQLNTGNATGGQDFAVGRIVAIPPSTP